MDSGKGKFNTIEEYITNTNNTCTEKVKSLSSSMVKIGDIKDMLNALYVERQNAVDYYFSILNKVSDLSAKYKSNYANKYNAVKVSNNIRYSSDTAINAQVSGELSRDIYVMEIMGNHAKFMQETIKTIDSIIYSIQNRIKLEELLRI
jgi:hypothetical protein